MENGSVTVIYTQEEYYFRAFENMLNYSEHVLRKLFQARWEEKFKENWDYWKPSSTQVEKLLDMIKKYLNKTQKSKLELACMGDWDMTLLCIILTKYWDEDSHQFINEKVRRLKCFRNDMAHNPSKMICQEEYNQMVTEFSEHLQFLDVNDVDIKQIIQEAESTTTIATKSTFVSSIEGINELTTWNKFSYGLKCVILNRKVLFQDKIVRFNCLRGYNLENLEGHLLVQLANGEIPSIVRSNAPPKIDYYVNRKMRAAHILKREVFQSETNDVFVIEGIEKWELTKLAGGCETDVSSNQTRCLTVRFVLLERKRDFDMISKISKNVPVHWIRIGLKTSATSSDSDSKMEFVWVKSSGSVNTLQKYVIRNEHKEVVEVGQFISAKNDVMVISGSPGMGKTCLVTNIAHDIMKQNENANVYLQFINLKEFVQAVGSRGISIDSIISLIAEQSSEYNFGRKLVEEYLRTKRCFLMFDGFDEVLSHQFNKAKEILKIVRTLSESILVIVTTRPHMRDELENELHTLAYEIKPLNDSDQMVLLLKFWESNGIEANTSVQKFARYVLQCLQENNVCDSSNHVAGLPLQCQLLAETCLEEVERYSKMRSSQVNRNGKNYSIFEMYQVHMNLRLQQISTHDSVFQRLLQFVMNMKKHYESIKEAHMYYALKLLFPESVASFQSLNSSSITLNELCGLGILEATNSKDIRFVHRTFAEYLVAWFVVERIENFAFQDFILSRIFNTTPINVQLSSVLGCPENIKAYKFEFPVVCYFINEFLARNPSQISPIYNYNLCAESVPIFFASSYHNYQNVLMAVANILHYKPNYKQDFKKTRGSDLLLIAAQYGDVKLMKGFCEMWDVSKFQFKTSTFSVIKQFVITPLHVAVQRGHYNLVEFLLLNGKGLSENLTSLLYVCLSGTLKDDKATILQKKQIIRLLLINFKNCITGEDRFVLDETVKLFKSVVNAELLQCVIHGGGGVSVCDRQQDHHDDADISEFYKLRGYALSDIAGSCSERSFDVSFVSEPTCSNLLQVRMSNVVYNRGGYAARVNSL